MPTKEHSVRQGLGESLVYIGEHLGDAAFGWFDPAHIGLKAKLTPQRRLHTVAIEELTFDFGGLEGFGAQ